MALNISKSKYCMAIQCPKMLWLKKNRPELFDDSVLNESILETGNEVGDLAMGLFGDFVEVPFGDLKDMLSKTSELISIGTPIIAEASFAYEGLFCSVDILKNLGNKEVELYEVKSSTEIKDIYYDDVAFQCYVLTQLGYSVKRASIVYINNQYVRHGDLDIHQLFNIDDVTTIVRNKQKDVASYIMYLSKYMQETEEPSCDIGTHCSTPYNCGFWGHCTCNLPKPNVFDVAGLWKSKKFDFYHKGIISFQDLYAAHSLSQSQNRQVEYELHNCAPYIDSRAIKSFLDTLSYPLYFLDFETYQSAIPMFENMSPYEQIPFQYSLHFITEYGCKLQHTEFLAYPDYDPRRALAEQLCRDIPRDVCTLAYNMSFEKRCIKSLAQLYPDLLEHLMNIHDNMRDLMVPFQKGDYYDRAMQGSYSIKYVLPALFPDDPSLNYHNLEGVHNGAEASATYRAMFKMDYDELMTYRKHLLKYCGLDTFAMVKLIQKLYEAVGVDFYY